jgi:hypothetical protein
MYSEMMLTILPPELAEDVELLIPAILPPDEVLLSGSEAKGRVCFEERCIEGLGIANTGFTGKEPEIVVPQELVKELISENPSAILVERVLADGNKVLLPRLYTLLMFI